MLTTAPDTGAVLFYTNTFALPLVMLQQVAEYTPLVIDKIVPEAEDAKTFVLKVKDGRELAYAAGQFLTLVFEKQDGEEARRNYSISSAPVLNEPLQITIKRIENGEYSRILIDKAREGDVLYTIGASGFFTLPPAITTYSQVFFFAAGSGITPVFALIKTLLHQDPSIHIVLVYSNRTTGSAIFYHQLRQLREKYYQRFEVEFLFSSEKSVLHKRLGVYLLEKFLEKYIKGVAADHLYYICGPFEYMRMITIVLRNHGIPWGSIRKEIFSIEKPVQKEQPPDTDPHLVTAHIRGAQYSFEVRYPQTILQAAKEKKIPLPYSCESGQCGTCAVTCTAGKIWMWHNEVLLDDEIAAGRALTCTGFGVGGNVVITI